MPRLELRLLGPPRAELDGRPVALSGKAMALLCYLGAMRQVHARDRLAALLWPDVPDRKAQASLRNALYELRRALGAEADGLLLVDRTRVGLRPDAELAVDAADFAAASESDAADDPGSLQRSVDAYAGSFLDGFAVAGAPDFDDWVFLERERLEGLYIAALFRLAAVHGAEGRHQSAIDLGRRILAVDPLREDVHRLLMRHLAASGQRGAALAQYRECREVLSAELGVEPLEATAALHGAIRAGRAPDDDVAGPGPLHRAAAARTVAPPAAPPALEASGPIVGRAGERARLAEVWRRAADGHGGVLVLSGEAGIGKTRLAGEIAGEAASVGLVLCGRCYEATIAEPYGPIVEGLRGAVAEVDPVELGLPEVWIRELARLLPELEVRLPAGSRAPLDGVRDRDRLFEAVRTFVGALAARRPVLWVVEDLHWADETSLAMLSGIARGADRQRLLLVCTVRGAEVAADRRAALRSLARHGETIDLGPLTAAESAELVAGLGAAPDPPLRFGQRLHHRTGGNPFFIVEMLRALFEQGTLRSDGGAWTTRAGGPDDDYADLPIPESVGLIVASRLDRLHDDARALLEAAAAIRRDFEFDAAAAAAGLPPTAALDALDVLVAAGLVREIPGEGARACRYDFVHALVRDHVYASLGGARRQYLHRRIAGLLEASRPLPADRIAYHYLRSGVRDRACAWSLRAGQSALDVYAAEGALVHFRSARELAVEPAEEMPALVGIGDAFVGLGRHEEAIRAFTAVLPLAPAGEDRAELHRRIGRAHDRQGAYDRALEAYGQARAELRGRPLSLASIRIADGLATVYVRLDRSAEARELCTDALEWADAHPEVEGTRAARAWLHNTLGMARMHGGDYAGALSSLEAGLALKRELGDRLGEATLLNNLGVVHYHRGADDEARVHYGASLDIKTAIGDGYGRAIALTNLALVETHLGRLTPAGDHIEEALVAAGDTGAAWLLPEIRRVAAQRALDLGDLPGALEAAEGSLAAAEDLGVPAFIGVAHRVLGLVKAAARGEPDEAREHFETSLAVFEMLENEHELAKTHAAYGRVLAGLGAEDAEEHLRAAADVFARSGAEGRLRRLEPLLGR